MGPSGAVQLLVAGGFVCLLAGLHVAQWAQARLTSPFRQPVRLDQVVHDLVGGRDPLARGLLVTAVVAVSFAFGAPMFPNVLRALGSVFGGA